MPADDIKVDVAALPASGAVIEASAAELGAVTGAGAAQSAATTAAGAAPDGVSAAITAAMSPWPGERAGLLAKAAALAEHTAVTDRTSAATLESQDSHNATCIAATTDSAAALGR